MKKRIISAVLLAVALVFEILPYGAVCNFANPEGEPFRKTYSYFDLTPFGYANFGPFITAILTCVLLALSIVRLYKNKDWMKKSTTVISLVAVISSLLPLMYGTKSFSALGAVISVLLLIDFGLLVIKNKRIGIAFCTPIIVIGLALALYLGSLHYFNSLIVNSKPDTYDWVLTNGEYTVCPTIDENVTFCVKNSNNEIVFTAKESWRAWDFEAINIDENNDIVVISNDIGEVKYTFDEVTWEIEE